MAFYPLALVPLGSLVWVALNWPAPGRAPTANVRVGARAVDEHHAAVRRARGDHERAGARHRRAGAVLLRRLLPPPRRAHREAAAQLRRRTGRVLRRDVRPGGQRQHAGALRVLGAHHRAVVPAGRPLRRTRHQPTRRHPGAAGDDVRRAGHAGRHRRARQHRRHLSVVRTDRRAADGPGRIGRRGAGADRRAGEVGDRADALLAAGRDGRADTGQRVPARRGDGQGRRLSRRADDARLRRLAAMAADGGDPRCAHHAAGRLACGARIRPEVDPGVRHGQPARADHRDGRRRRRRPDAGRAGHAVRARHVQGGAVHGRRRHRPRHRHPRHPQAGLARSAQQAAADHCRRRDRKHGRAAAVPRLRRQGGRLRNRRAQRRHSAPPRPTSSPASCSARCSPPSTACGSSWERSGARDDRNRANGSPKCTARQPLSLSPRPSWPRRAWCSGCGLPASTTCCDSYADTVPGGENYDLALWHGLGAPLLLSALVLAVGGAVYFARARLRRLRTVRTPLGNADRIYDAVLRGLDLAVRAADRDHPSAARSRRHSR